MLNSFAELYFDNDGYNIYKNLMDNLLTLEKITEIPFMDK